MRAVLFTAALLLAPASASLAQSAPSNAFTVQDVAKTPRAPLLLDGVNWRCNAENICTGAGTPSQPAPRACRRVAQRLGTPLASFTYRGTTLSAADLATCNQAAAG
ncbi:hypothetical protein BZG35_10830 [Brevundimonas sp. LM2]|uniref:CC_3452 family protein n=1 Tax=Brevundimonas sp. LM2 TaxID=1938605 RepID=UPI000983E583|nr:hypothetical protein [Brevundimonas sp. LM2]AQR62082.1 hypothetical protein BZG35_10830 [Brevundimonas sp. LM2]